MLFRSGTSYELTGERNMSNQDKLQTVTIAFEQWRNIRMHRTTKTPKALCQQAVKLLPHYPISQIIKTLKLSHAQLKGWNNGSSNKNSCLTPKRGSFVRLAEVNETSEPSPSLTLEWQLSDGVFAVSYQQT